LATKGSSSAAAVWAVLRKECRSEWRTRYGLNAALLFAITTLVSVSFAALSSLSHTFVREVEGHTLTMLRLVASPAAISTGKLLFNVLFLAVLEVVTVPLYLLLMDAKLPSLPAFLGVLALGSLALAASATLVGAVIAQTRGRGALFAGVSLPLLLPVLAAAVSGTRAPWQGGDAIAEMRLLGAYTAGVLAVSVLLYDHLWED
jgi:heme exporter protein B